VDVTVRTGYYCSICDKEKICRGREREREKERGRERKRERETERQRERETERKRERETERKRDTERERVLMYLFLLADRTEMHN
jgi:hypothetical protein